MRLRLEEPRNGAQIESLGMRLQGELTSFSFSGDIVHEDINLLWSEALSLGNPFHHCNGIVHPSVGLTITTFWRGKKRTNLLDGLLFTPF